MKSESLTEFICSNTGISKRNLANFIDTHQSILSRADAGTRSLPGKALPALATMYSHLYTASENDLPQPAAESVAEIQAQAKWCLARCHPLQKKLAAMRQCCSQANKALALLEVLEKNMDTTTPKKQRWIEEQRYQAQKKLLHNGWDDQLKISVAIELLQYEAVLYANALEQFSKKEVK